MVAYPFCANGVGMLTFPEIAVIFGASLCCTALAVLFIRRSRPAPQPVEAFPPEPMSFLFDDGVLHHATQSGLTAFGLLPGAHVWNDLRDSLLARFPQFPETATSDAIGSMTVHPLRKDDPGVLTLRWRDCLCWVELNDTGLQASVMPEESAEPYEVLRRVCETSKEPAWETLPCGIVGWRNAAYEDLLDRCDRTGNDALFQTSAEVGTCRMPLTLEQNSLEWFDVSSHQHGAGMVHHATSVTHLQRAEDAQRTFVQTLAKTFAQLPIGLAIFDRHEQLSIFNPALVELSGLQAEYLASQPTMLSFFDSLRENRQMPEPKNYNAWRNQISAMIAAATDGQYHETWTLEDGRTYAVQGRPHPDGATAFLIEDISAEVTLTRNFKTEVEHYEALLNTVEDALVVFSSGGVVTYSNSAYHQMWDQNPESAFADVTVKDAVDQWQSKAQADWRQISDFIKTLRSTETLDVDMVFRDKRKITARLTPMGAEATLIRFRTIKQQTGTEHSTTG